MAKRLQKCIYSNGGRTFVQRSVYQDGKRSNVIVYVKDLDEGLEVLNDMYNHSDDYEYLQKLAEESRVKYGVAKRSSTLRNIIYQNSKWVVYKTINNKQFRWNFKTKAEAVRFRDKAQRKNWDVSKIPSAKYKHKNKYTYGRFEEKLTVETKHSRNKHKPERNKEYEGKNKGIHRKVTVNYDPLKNKDVQRLADRYELSYHSMVSLLINLGMIAIKRLNFIVDYEDI